MNCPETDVLYRYISKDMSSKEREKINNHLTSCKDCKARLNDLSEDMNKIESFLKSYEWDFDDDDREDRNDDNAGKEEQAGIEEPEAGIEYFKAQEKPSVPGRYSSETLKHYFNSTYLSLWKILFLPSYSSYRLKISFAAVSIVLILFFSFLFAGSSTLLAYKYRVQSAVSPQDPAPYYNLGLLMREKNNMVQARDLIKKAYLLNNNYSLSYYNFGDNYLPDLKKVVIFSDITSGEDDMLHGLASLAGDKLASVKSLSPTSIEMWKGIGDEKKLDEAAKSAEELGGDYLLFLESLTVEENKYALTYSLINIFERKIISHSTVTASDLFGLQFNLVLEVAKTLTGNLTEMEEKLLHKKDFKKEEAFKLYLEGKSCYYRYTEEDNKRAIELFKKSIALEPDAPLSYSALSDALTQEYGLFSKEEPELIEEAMSYANKALEINPDLPEAYKSLGLSYIYLGERERAEKEYKKALALNENYSEAYINLGMLYMNEKDFPEAVNMLNEAIDIDGGSPEAYKELAGCYLFERDFDRSITFYEKAIEIGFLNAHSVFQAYSNLALCYEVKGLYDKALPYFEKALELKPESGETCYKMAEIFNINGDREKSIKYYRDYIRLEPEGRYIDTARDTLKLLKENNGKVEGLVIFDDLEDLSDISLSFKDSEGKIFTSMTDENGFYSLVIPEEKYKLIEVKREDRVFDYKKTGIFEMRAGQIEVVDVYLLNN